MRVLLAEDESTSRQVLRAALERWGYEVVLALDGDQALEVLQAEDRPLIAIVNWFMPGVDGAELCRRIRSTPDLRSIYMILLTARDSTEDIVEGLQAGADDYVTKPFDNDVMRARVQVGARVVNLRSELANRVIELEEALSRVTQLQGLLPICSYCKRIRDDHDYWQQVEGYISEHSDARFSHSICPDCHDRHIRPQIDELEPREKRSGGTSKTRFDPPSDPRPGQDGGRNRT